MIGPSFQYSALCELVGGRAGTGPIWVAWDTNVLSLYEEYGESMWDEEEIVVQRADPVEVRALGTLVAIWMWWDLRFMVLELTESDSKKARQPSDIQRREISMNGLAAALSLGLDGVGTRPESRQALDPELLDCLPKGHDRRLVHQAHAVGADVFLTTDKGILKRDIDLTKFGLRCLKPTQLVNSLVEAGVPLGWAPTSLGGLAPDLGRMSALIAALEQNSDR